MFNLIQIQKTTKPSTSKFLQFLLIVNTVLALILFILTFIPALFRFEEKIGNYVFIAFVTEIVLLILVIVRYIFFNERTISYAGKLILNQDSIQINEEIFPLDNIRKIRFKGNDIKDDFRGYVSKGNKNFLYLTFNNGEEKEFQFEQTKENSLRNLEGLLKIYLDRKLLSESNLENILNNTNYY